MKTTRDQLKSLVKELLLEVLQEGLGSVGPPPQRAAGTSMVENRQRARRPTGRPTFDPRLDTPLAGGRQATDMLRDAVKRESGGNSVLANILADTAVTTLPTQLSHGDSMGRPGGVSRAGAPVQQEQFNGDVAEVFGESAEMRSDGSSHWADLAFMPAGKKTA